MHIDSINWVLWFPFQFSIYLFFFDSQKVFYITLCLSCVPHKNFISFCCLPLNLKMIYDAIHSIPIDLKCYQYYILFHIYTQISLWTFKNNPSACSSTCNGYSIFKLFWFISILFLLLLLSNTIIIVIPIIYWSRPT